MIIDDKALDPCFIEKDNLSYMVKNKSKKTTNKKGVVNYPIEGYYSDLTPCIKKIIELKFSDVDDKFTLMEFLSRYSDIKYQIQNAVGL